MKALELAVLKEVRAHEKAWTGCKRCPIHAFVDNYVFWRGSLPCHVLFIGEAPGKQEDKHGEPFVGASGKLLNRWIKYGFRGTRLRWAVTNVTCCRPTDFKGGPNRPPTNREASNCESRLQGFIKIARPKAVVLLGKVASIQTMGLLTEFGDATKRDSPRNLLHLYHPSYILRCGGRESEVYRKERKRLRNFIRFLKENGHVTA